jgi:S1-C subfamily serine protease
MKSTIYLVLIGIVAISLTALFYASNKAVFEAVEKPAIDTPENLVLTEEEAKDLSSEVLTNEKEKTNDVAEIIQEEVIENEPIIEQIPVAKEKIEIIAEIPQISFSKINEATREALVNIFCITKSGGSFKPITGSGVIIDERGIILTNAHVAQYFLLKDYLTENFIDCVIRTGSPAQPRYIAKLIFISPSWIKENANGIIQQSPKGTGENDFALLFITGRTDPTKTVPEKFSFIPLLYDTSNISIGDNVLLAGYPAGFLSGIVISKDLYISSTVTQIMEVFTFKEGALDLFSIGGSVVAQQGSSGGAVVNDKNELIGIIVTSSVAESTSDRDLRAITAGHINTSFTKEMMFNLQALLTGDISAKADVFNENIAPLLTQLLVDELDK